MRTSIEGQIRKEDGVISKTVLSQRWNLQIHANTRNPPKCSPPKNENQRTNDVKFRKNKKKTAQSYREGFCFGIRCVSRQGLRYSM